jgi:hypothetical protein
MAVGAGVQAYAVYKQGQHQAAVSTMNARMAEQNRAQAMQAGASQAGQIRSQGGRAISSIEARAGAGNIDTTSGSAADALAGLRASVELDAETAKANAVRRAWGLDVESQMHRFSASAAKFAGTLGAVGVGIGGVGGAAAMASRGK